MTVERPKNSEHGDYATNVALQLAKQAGLPPRDFAELVADAAGRPPTASRRSRSPVPGFLNISVDAGAQGAVAAQVVAAGCGVRRLATLCARQKVNLEFVSANPTGPVHLGGARWAAVGDALARLLEATGAEVTREYYFNDHGAQIDRFAGRCWPRAQRRAGARGRLRRRSTSPRSPARSSPPSPRRPDLPDDEALEVVPGARRRADVRRDQADAARLPASTSTSTSTRTTCTSPAPSTARIARLARARQHLRAGRRGLAAHREVRRRQGPRHRQVRRPRRLHLRRRGVLPRQAGARLRPLHHHARRRPPRLRRPDDGAVRGLRRRARASTSRSSSARWSTCSATAQPLRMGKRAGNVDHAARPRRGDRRRRRPLRAGAQLAPTPTSTSTSTCGPRRPATTRSSTCSTPTPGSASILRNAADLGLEPRPTLDPDAARPREGGRAAARARRVPAGRRAPRPTLREPHRVARYLEDTAASYHRFYDACRVLPMGDEEPSDLHRARLLLVEATRIVLANGLAPARGLRPRADVTAAHAHPRGRLGARRRRAARPALAARARRPNALVPRLWSTTAHKVDGDLVVGGVPLPDLVADVNTPAYVLDEADFRARARAFRDAFAGVRRLLRRQGLPVHDGRALGRRGGALPRRLLRRRADRRAAGRLRPGPDRLPRQQQDRAASCAGRSPRGSAGSSSTPSTRSTGWRAVTAEPRPHRSR